MLNFDFSKFHLGIFDSGLGGKHVSLQIEQRFPQIKITTLADQKNIPYGRKTPQQMLTCIKPFIRQFEELKVDLIILACNTCFLNLADDLSSLTKIPIIGYEPALALAAAESQTQSIVVCATAGALKSQRWQRLKTELLGDYKITDIDCSDWVPLIENSQISWADLQKVIDRVRRLSADSLVLGCTHYHWLLPAFRQLVVDGYQLQFYEPTQEILKEINHFLKNL